MEHFTPSVKLNFFRLFFFFVLFQQTNKSSILHKDSDSLKYSTFRKQKEKREKERFNFAESFVDKILECKGTFWSKSSKICRVLGF